MPGYAFHSGAIFTCPHGGIATVVPTPPRVLVGGFPVATSLSQITVAGCTFTTPCVTVKWINVATRVTAGGQPVLLQAPPSGPGNAACAPTPGPPTIASMQVRVTAS